MRIQIDYDDRQVTQMLQRLIDAGTSPRPALKEIGEDLADSAKKRFETTSGPDGAPWERNAASTIKRKGRDKPLTGKTGKLMDQINYQLIADDTLEVGSPMVYAAMQQFGGSKTQFPSLWGDIPARPFIGISGGDEENIIGIFNRYLRDAI